MPRVAGTVIDIILYVRNLSSSDVLVTENITKKPAVKSWLQRKLPPTSRILDYPNYGSIENILQITTHFESNSSLWVV